ncbi:MAG: C4-dicarboxylate ABC transporter substrate-binding protein, partial [Proteobacteria bacterium]|nr:C4-dicarboxylate ABC transporter substrate-binding protein [Pseudomonadota bacterium]
MKTFVKTAVCALAVVGLMAVGSGGAVAQGKIVLQGASQFDENHAFTRLMRKFEQLVEIYYTGDREIEFVMHPNSE